MVNSWFAGIVAPLGGKTNFDEGMFVVAAMTPIGAGLHDPVLICWPLVIGAFTVRQKLMKLLVEVSDATWPAAGTCCPSWAKPVAMTAGLRATQDRYQRQSRKE